MKFFSVLVFVFILLGSVLASALEIPSGRFKGFGNAKVFELCEKKGKPYIKIHIDGRIITQELKIQSTPKGIRLEYKEHGEFFGEYYILTKAGVLEYYDKQNKKLGSGVRL